MEASNVQMYTIKHASESGDPVEIPTYPSSVTPSDNLVSKSWNNMYGEFKDIPVNLKTKIIWKFDAISETELNTLYNELIRSKILQYKSRFFYVNTYFPGVGFVSGLYYLGTPTTFNSLGGAHKGAVNWFSGEIHWIEVDGVRLNDPTQNNLNNL